MPDLEIEHNGRVIAVSPIDEDNEVLIEIRNGKGRDSFRMHRSKAQQLANIINQQLVKKLTIKIIL